MRNALWTLGVSLSVFAQGCGSRSALLSAELVCDTDADCSTDLCQPARCQGGQCVVYPIIECESDDPCFTVRCVPETGGCEYESVSVDLDGDGFYAPLPDGSCGNDCDDTSPRAHPGASEVCDRVDNDCDGVVDNGLPILPSSSGALMAPVRVASEARVLSGSRGMAFGQGVFALGYRARDRSLSENQSFIQWREASGALTAGEKLVSSVNVGSYGTPLAWSGQNFGAAWQDARSGNYEVYFTLFAPSGEKRLADLRLTETMTSSWAPEVLYDQGRFLVLWQEILQRPGPQIRAQFVSADGRLIGENVELTPLDGKDYGFVAVEANPRGYGIVYTATNTKVAGGNIEVEFRAFAKDLTPTSPTVQVVASGGDRPKIAALGDNFLVTWDVEDRSAIWGAVLSPEGAMLAGPTPLTPASAAARDNNLLSFGDRVLLAWAELAGDDYDIFGTVIGENLQVLEAKRELVGGAANSIEPRLVRGDNGFVGALFDDFREGVQHAHFMAFACEPEVLK